MLGAKVTLGCAAAEASVGLSVGVVVVGFDVDAAAAWPSVPLGC